MGGSSHRPYANELHSRVPIKLYLQKHAADQIWSTGHSLPNTAPNSYIGIGREGTVEEEVKTSGPGKSNLLGAVQPSV
jgi:hypothetical protein